jgi:hypothetical protein
VGFPSLVVDGRLSFETEVGVEQLEKLMVARSAKVINVKATRVAVQNLRGDTEEFI